MSTKEIRLIAMDMDGTLLNEEQKISQKNAAALQEAVSQGIHIAICSGRLGGDAALFALDAGLDTCHILALNGAHCLESPRGETYAVRRMDREAAEGCLAVLAEYDCTYACFQPEGAVIFQSARRGRAKRWGSYREREGAPVYRHGPEALREALPQGLCKIVVVEDEDMGLLESIRQQLSLVPGLDVTSSWQNNLEIMPAGVTKGAAVEELAKRLGLAAGQVMTLGDYDNDLSMIEYAGFGVAMGNATEKIKRAARYVTLSNAEDGLAEAIRRWAL